MMNSAKSRTVLVGRLYSDYIALGLLQWEHGDVAAAVAVTGVGMISMDLVVAVASMAVAGCLLMEAEVRRKGSLVDLNWEA